MNKSYFIVVLAHSLHGRIRRFHIDQKVIMAVLGLAVLGCFTLFGMVSSYVRMAWKVSNYNHLRQEADVLRGRYRQLLNESHATTEQMTRLQLFASEVSVAYGIRRQNVTAAPAFASTADSGRLVPQLNETFEQYNLLKTASLTSPARSFSHRWLMNIRPSLWPVTGRLLSHFGTREDPFTAMQAFHSGVDISAPQGTPVHVAADGIVVRAEWFGGYGKVVVVDHGKGLQSYYAHLSRIDVIPGQEVHMGDVIAGTGATGRATTPHLHYEVRIGGSPVNPYPYLAHAGTVASAPKNEFGF